MSHIAIGNRTRGGHLMLPGLWYQHVRPQRRSKDSGDGVRWAGLHGARPREEVPISTKWTSESFEMEDQVKAVMDVETLMRGGT